MDSVQQEKDCRFKVGSKSIINDGESSLKYEQTAQQISQYVSAQNYISQINIKNSLHKDSLAAYSVDDMQKEILSEQESTARKRINYDTKNFSVKSFMNHKIKLSQNNNDSLDGLHKFS
jgi:hypothetical protein